MALADTDRRRGGRRSGHLCTGVQTSEATRVAPQAFGQGWFGSAQKLMTDAGYRLAGVVGVDPNLQPLGKGIKWRYVLMRSLNSTQVWGGACLILSEMLH